MKIEDAFKNRKSGISITLEGKVSRILEDDHDGIHHQRFIVQVPTSQQGGLSGQTVLIAHNLERAYRAPVKLNDNVEIHGTYAWNKLGGVVHNTHHDDRKDCDRKASGKIICGPKHEDGWIVFVGKKSPHRTQNLPHKS